MRWSAVRQMSVILLLVAASANAASDSGWVRIVAVPDGSPVFLDGRFVGNSPIDSVRCAAGSVVVEVAWGSRFLWNARASADTVHVTAGELTEVRMTSSNPGPSLGTVRPLGTPAVLLGPGELGVRSETWTAASGAAIVVSGVLAAVFRHQANEAAARYLETRDPSALDDVRRFDRFAGAAMVGVQISLGAFVLSLAGP